MEMCAEVRCAKVAKRRVRIEVFGTIIAVIDAGRPKMLKSCVIVVGGRSCLMYLRPSRNVARKRTGRNVKE